MAQPPDADGPTVPDDYQSRLAEWTRAQADYESLPSPGDMWTGNTVAIAEAAKTGKAAPMLRAILDNQLSLYTLIYGVPPEPETPGEVAYRQYCETPEARRHFREMLDAARKK